MSMYGYNFRVCIKFKSPLVCYSEKLDSVLLVFVYYIWECTLSILVRRRNPVLYCILCEEVDWVNF